MIYQIKKSLGWVSAILSDTVTKDGICVEFKNYGKYSGTTIIIYQNGKPEDLSVNGWTFPCVYNNLDYLVHDDIYGGKSVHTVSFECLDPTRTVQKIEKKSIYGDNQPIAVEYFYSLLYNISCCQSFEQYQQLYKYIIDNEWFYKDKERKAAVEVLSFVETFASQLENIKDKEFLAGLKQKVDLKFKEAKDIIAMSNSPV